MTLSFELIKNANKHPLTIYSSIVIRNDAYSRPPLVNLFDTGASLPVWVSSPDTITDYFPSAYLAPYKAVISGFGGAGKIVPVVILPKFCLSDKSAVCIYFIDLPVLVSPQEFPCNMILSFSMFQHMKFSYTPGNNPKLVFDADKQIYGFGKRIIDGKPLGVAGTLLRDIYVLSQDTD